MSDDHHSHPGDHPTLKAHSKGTLHTAPEEEFDMKAVINKAAHKALGGGLAGASAMVIQVTSLMWMRTTMNYQYRHGTSTAQAMRTLYADGGLRRFYRGYGPAIAQGPLSRFGDTAANAGAMAFMDANPSTKNLPSFAKTMVASSAAAAWRIFLMPIDTTKTIMQVEGKNGLSALGKKIKAGGPPVLYHGALAASAATWVGHFPWFATFNYLNGVVPQYDGRWEKLGRNAALGFVSSVVSDTTSNSIRVIKTTKQTHTSSISYPEAVRTVIAKDGVSGLFFRGLSTRILANGVQGCLFAVLWRGFQDTLFKNV